MYIPAAYRIDDRALLLTHLRAARLGLLMTNGAGGEAPDISPVPWLISPDGNRLTAHVAKANPHAKIPAEGLAAAVVFLGAEAYVSPNWYPSKAETHKAVPTWNYQVIRVTGLLKPFTDRDRLLALVQELTRLHEADQPKPWSTDDAPAEYIDAMLKGIVGLDLEITAIEGKAKFTQNRSRADYDGVISGMAGKPDPRDQAAAAAMRAVHNPPAV
jgi:transcriptional regulator